MGEAAPPPVSSFDYARTLVDELEPSVEVAAMTLTPISIELRRPRQAGEALFLLGPGGVGKSTLGLELARKLAWPLVDLDLEFCQQLGLIGDFLRAHGYERYREANLALAQKLVSFHKEPIIFVTASGFLAAQAGTRDNAEAHNLIATGYGITLLPSLDLEAATQLVVARQMTRGFDVPQELEDRKFRERFPIYLREGDALVVSVASPPQIADTLIEALNIF